MPINEGSLYIIGTRTDRRQKDEGVLGYTAVKVGKGGRRRFHGAFTGGFSAGYFNTCGSEEGFVPREYVSTSKKRKATSQILLSDLMDEEDLAMNRELLSVRPEYDVNKKAKLYRTQGSHFGFELSATIMSNSESTLGDKILQKWGWRPGKSIGKRRKIVRPDTKKEVEVFVDDPMLRHPTIKENMYGLGYARDALDKNREHNRNLDRQQEVTDRKIKGGRFNSSSGQYGFGTLENIDDEFSTGYSESSKSEYDTSIGTSNFSDEEEFRATKFQRPVPKKKSRWGPKHKKENLVKGFIQAINYISSIKKFPNLRVPKDFRGEHVFSTNTIELIPSLTLTRLKLSLECTHRSG